MLFSTFGPVLDIVALKTMEMRGQAHIVFRDIQAATQAMRSLDGQTFLGRPMVRIPPALHALLTTWRLTLFRKSNTPSPNHILWPSSTARSRFQPRHPVLPLWNRPNYSRASSTHRYLERPPRNLRPQLPAKLRIMRKMKIAVRRERATRRKRRARRMWPWRRTAMTNDLRLLTTRPSPSRTRVPPSQQCRYWVAISLGTHKPTQPPTRPNQIMR